MPDTLLIVGLSVATVTAAFTWQAARTVGQEPVSPNRLVAELRLAQVGGLLLALVAGAYVGMAALLTAQPGAGLDVVLALGFVGIAIASATREPHEALTVVAVGFVAHALVDLMHRPGGLTDGAVPRWYVIGCAVHNIYMAVLCYLPVIRR